MRRRIDAQVSVGTCNGGINKDGTRGHLRQHESRRTSRAKQPSMKEKPRGAVNRERTSEARRFGLTYPVSHLVQLSLADYPPMQVSKLVKQANTAMIHSGEITFRPRVTHATSVDLRG